MAKQTYTDFDTTLQARANDCIAHGALTNSKRPSSYIEGVFPTHLKKQKGAYSYDDKSNRYIDFISGLGSNILGYGNESIDKAITDQLKNGITFSLGTELEVQLAEQLKGIFNFCDQFRFLKTGSDACSAAIKIARAYTGRDIVLTDGYHGFHDAFVSVTPPAYGVHLDQGVYKFDNEFLSIFSDKSGIAAIIVEPIITDHSPARIEYLKKLREYCTARGILLIFDEVITGFRYPKFSVSNYYGVIPDLICIGKGMANGMPISAVGGKKEIMSCENEYFISSTFAGETLSIAAALQTIKLLQSEFNLDKLWDAGSIFQNKFNAIAPDIVKLEGYPTRGVFKGSDDNLDLFRQEACKAGILLSTSFFFNFSHIDLTDQVISTFKDILIRIKTGLVKLEGKPSSKPFAQKQREIK